MTCVETKLKSMFEAIDRDLQRESMRIREPESVETLLLLQKLPTAVSEPDQSQERLPPPVGKKK